MGLIPPYLSDLAPCDFFFVLRDESEFERDVVADIAEDHNENHWQPLTAFPLKILDNVSSSGIGAGINASSHRGCTWKGTKVSNLYDYFK